MDEEDEQDREATQPLHRQQPFGLDGAEFEPAGEQAWPRLVAIPAFQASALPPLSGLRPLCVTIAKPFKAHSTKQQAVLP